MIYTDLAQDIIDKFVTTLRKGGGRGFREAADDLLRQVVSGLHADLGLIWLIANSELRVYSAFAPMIDTKKYQSLRIDSVDGTSLILALMSNGDAAVKANSTSEDWKPILRKTKDFEYHLITGLNARGVFPGMVSIHSKHQREWSEEDCSTLQEVASMLAVIVSYEMEIQRIKPGSQGSQFQW